MDNAAKHGGAGKRIDTAIFPDGNEVVITVRDYGPGIPPEELPNVKYKFYKEAPPPGAAASAWRCARRSSPGTMES
ncbi:MAG: ATP-binding protein [Evtepia gabavorous]